ncbi:hypothetical protein [Halobacteriaceae bacterium SHR40]|uniref:hypothetical protein n=1 Tax=Halovenus amylolytica TaxID=2500550 RepID=UPI000FE36C29
MLDRIRDLGPVVLVPAAWIATLATILDFLGSDGMAIAHAVMVAFISFFLLTGYQSMSDGALRAWRGVMIVGLPITAAGLVGFFVSSGATALFSISLVGWMLLPAAGLAYTAGEIPDARVMYAGAALISVLGAVGMLAFIAGMDELFAVVGIALVGIGHTVGIAEASLRDQSH